MCDCALDLILGPGVGGLGPSTDAKSWKKCVIFLQIISIFYFQRSLSIWGRRVVKIREWLSLAISNQAFWLDTFGLKVSFKIFTARLGLSVWISQMHFQKNKNNVQSLLNLKICTVRYSHVISFKFLTVHDLYKLLYISQRIVPTIWLP